MDEKKFEEVLGELPRTFRPPVDPRYDEMWSAIEAAHFDTPAKRSDIRRRTLTVLPWLAAAAAQPPRGSRARIRADRAASRREVEERSRSDSSGRRAGERSLPSQFRCDQSFSRMSTLMSRAKFLALFAAVAFVSTVNAQT